MARFPVQKLMGTRKYFKIVKRLDEILRKVEEPGVAEVQVCKAKQGFMVRCAGHFAVLRSPTKFRRLLGDMKIRRKKRPEGEVVRLRFNRRTLAELPRETYERLFREAESCS